MGKIKWFNRLNMCKEITDAELNYLCKMAMIEDI